MKSLTEQDLITACGGVDLSQLNHDFNKGYAVSHVDGAIAKLDACGTGGNCKGNALNAMQAGAVAASFGRTAGELADGICFGKTNIPVPNFH